jgi:uncharacterized protein YceH (UPF0502 family)
LGSFAREGSACIPFRRRETSNSSLLELADRELAERLLKRPGEREERWTKLLGGHSAGTDIPSDGDPAAPIGRGVAPLDLEARVKRLEQQFAELLERLDQLSEG